MTGAVLPAGMRNSYKIRKYARTTGTSAASVGGLLLTMLFTSSRLEESILYEWASTVASFLRTDLTGLIIGVAAFAGMGELARLWAGHAPFWHTVEPILNALRSHAFQREYAQRDPNHHNRATLFQYKQWRIWPFPWHRKWLPFINRPGGPGAGWLVPVARSGHTTQSSNSIFLAPDDADAAEGVAGHIWSCEFDIDPIVLPEVYDEQTAGEYAALSYETTEAVMERQRRKDRPLPRAMSGFPVFENGRIWGVVVLDSRRPDGIRDDNYEAVRIATDLFDKVLSQ